MICLSNSLSKGDSFSLRPWRNNRSSLSFKETRNWTIKAVFGIFGQWIFQIQEQTPRLSSRIVSNQRKVTDWGFDGGIINSTVMEKHEFDCWDTTMLIAHSAKFVLSKFRLKRWNRCFFYCIVFLRKKIVHWEPDGGRQIGGFVENWVWKPRSRVWI